MSNAPFLDPLLTSDEFYQDPHTVFHQFRTQAPVYWSEALGAWILTRYDDVMAVLRQPELFSSAGRVTYLLGQLDPETRLEVARLERHYEIGLAHSDPPDHTRLRALLNKVFTPRMVEAWRPRIQEVVQELIDEASSKNEFDFIGEFAYPLPATIIAEMIGTSRQDIPLFRDWAADINRLFALGGRISVEAALQAQNSLKTMREYITQMVEERRKNPADDLVGRLVASETEGEKLSLDELISTCVTFFVAGHETTTNLLGNGMYLLLKHPDQQANLRDNPALINSAIEEILRCEPSVPRTWRIVMQDTQIGDQGIQAASMVFPILSAANRDPAHFADPDTFDIRREQNKHLAFGYGIHFCMGAPLARVEGAIALNAILNRFPEIRLSGEPTWHKDIAIRGLALLKMTL